MLLCAGALARKFRECHQASKAASPATQERQRGSSMVHRAGTSYGRVRAGCRRGAACWVHVPLDPDKQHLRVGNSSSQSPGVCFMSFIINSCGNRPTPAAHGIYLQLKNPTHKRLHHCLGCRLGQATSPWPPSPGPPATSRQLQQGGCRGRPRLTTTWHHRQVHLQPPAAPTQPAQPCCSRYTASQQLQLAGARRGSMWSCRQVVQQQAVLQ